MRELNGVVALTSFALSDLKRNALLFDKLYGAELERGVYTGLFPHQIADLEFLENQKVFEVLPCSLSLPSSPGATDYDLRYYRTVRSIRRMVGLGEIPGDQLTRIEVAHATLANYIVRGASADLSKLTKHDPVPICSTTLPLNFPKGFPHQSYGTSCATSILKVAIESLPAPDDTCSWTDIFSFKSEARDKQWVFRRFLKDLATKRQTEAEIRDDIEWSLNEYTKAMDRFKLKRSVSFMETYVIPTVEAFETFKPSSFLKGLVAIKKRKIELLESEASAPGRECAYVFDARKRFGPK